MPHYVKIRNKKTGRELSISADVWNIQVERFKGKEMEFEEIHPATITIPRRSVNTNVGEPEKKSQVVADSVIQNAEKALSEIKPKDHLLEVPKSTEVELTPEIIKSEMESKIKVISEPKVEPKKRGRPKVIK